MAANKIGDLQVGLTADVNKFKEQLAQAAQSVNGFSTQIEKQMGTVSNSVAGVVKSFSPMKLAVGGIVGLLGGLTFGALTSSIEGVVHARAELYKLHENTGLAVEQLSALKTVADLADTSLETVAALTAKFSKSVGDTAKQTSVQAQAFKNLGIEVKDQNGHFKSNIDLQIEAARKLNEHSDSIEKDNYYMALWGKSALQSKEYLKELGKQTELHGKLSTEQAKKADELEKSMKLLNKAMNEWKNDLADAVIPTLAKFAGRLLDLKNTVGNGDWMKALFSGLLTADAGDIRLEIERQENAVKKQQALVDKIRKQRDENQGSSNSYLKEQLDRQLADASHFLDLELKKLDKLGGLKKKDDVRSEPDAPTGAKPPPKSLQTDETKVLDLTSMILQAQIKILETKDKIAGVDVTHLATLEREISLGKYKDSSPKELEKLKAVSKELDEQEKKLKDITEVRKQDDSLTKYIENLKAAQTIERSATEETRARAELQKEHYAKGSQALKDEVINQAKLLDAKKQQETVERAIGELQTATQDRVAQIDKEIVARRLSADALQRETELQALRIEFEKKLSDPSLNNDSRLKMLQELTEAEDKLRAAQERRYRDSQNWMSGAQSAIVKYRDELTNVANNTEQAFSRVFRNLEDSMFEFVKTGKLNFKGLISSMIDDLIRLQIKASMTPVFNALSNFGNTLLGAAFSSFGGSTVSAGPSAAAGGGSWLDTSNVKLPNASAKGNVFQGHIQAFANGGILNGPTLFPMNGGMGLAGEAGYEGILPLARNVNGKLGVIASGGQSTKQTINNISITVNGGKTNEETGRIIAEQTVRAIAQQEIRSATYNGGILNPMTIRG